MKTKMKIGLFIGVVALVVTASGMALSATKRALVVKIPLNSWTAVAAQKGWLQEEYAKYGAKIEIVDVGALKIPGVEASLLDKGELDFAFRMQYPSLQHKLNGLDAVIVWQSQDANVRRNTLVVLKDSPINKLSDLKGKVLGSWRISCPYFSAFEIFKVGKLPIDSELEKGEVRNINIQGTAATSALLGGKVDTLTVHPQGATTAALYTQGIVKEVARSVPGGVYVRGGGRTSIFSTRKFASEHPELVKAFLTVREKASAWILKHPDEAATIVARETRIPKHVAKFGIVDSSSYDFVAGDPDHRRAVDSIKLFQDWAIKNNDDFLKKKNLSYAEIERFVDKRFFKGGQYSIYN